MAEGEAKPDAPMVTASAPMADAVMKYPSDSTETEALTSRVSKATVRAVIRTGTISIRVADLKSAGKSLRSLVDRAGGYIESSSTDGYDTDRPTMTLTSRVPSTQFESLQSAVGELGFLTSSSSQTQDVTGQLVDFDARLRTLSAQEETLRSLLKRSGNLDQILKVEARLTEVRTEIETIAGQRKDLSDRARFSSLTVQFTQSKQLPPSTKDPSWVQETWTTSVASVLGTFRGVAEVVIRLIVFSPLWLPLIGLVFWLFGRIKRKIGAELEP